MLRLAADENFNGDIVRGLLRRLPDLDIVHVQDAGLSGADDLAVLEWAARGGRILLTHDISTLVSFAFERVAARRTMPGVVAARSKGPIGPTIDDLVLLVECSEEAEWEGRVLFLPMRAHALAGAWSASINFSQIATRFQRPTVRSTNLRPPDARAGSGWRATPFHSHPQSAARS